MVQDQFLQFGGGFPSPSTWAPSPDSWNDAKGTSTPQQHQLFYAPPVFKDGGPSSRPSISTSSDWSNGNGTSPSSFEAGLPGANSPSSVGAKRPPSPGLPATKAAKTDATTAALTASHSANGPAPHTHLKKQQACLTCKRRKVRLCNLVRLNTLDTHSPTPSTCPSSRLDAMPYALHAGPVPDLKPEQPEDMPSQPKSLPAHAVTQTMTRIRTAPTVARPREVQMPQPPNRRPDELPRRERAPMETSKTPRRTPIQSLNLATTTHNLTPWRLCCLQRPLTLPLRNDNPLMAPKTSEIGCPQVQPARVSAFPAAQRLDTHYCLLNTLLGPTMSGSHKHPAQANRPRRSGSSLRSNPALVEGPAFKDITSETRLGLPLANTPI